MNVYFTADIGSVLRRAPSMPGGVTVRELARSDIPALAELYLRSYDPPPVATLSDAAAEMTSAFDGDWGALWPAASPGAWVGGELVSVVQSVRCPSWPGTPECPWLIEVLTDPGYRRTGLARSLIAAACQVMAAAGVPRVGLTVDDGNVAAVSLYTSLGFAEEA